MPPEHYLPRIIDDRIAQQLLAYGGVVVEGPKWCGKTSAALQHANSTLFLGNPEQNFQDKMLAKIDINQALQGDTPRLLDEWQEIPEIWDAVRHIVDRRDKRGQFILTGSTTPKVRGVLHSGVGRIGQVKMRTMSLYESGDSTGDVSLEQVCTATFQPKVIPEPSLQNLAEYIIRGGWPGGVGDPFAIAKQFPKDYIARLLDHDIASLDDTRRNIGKVRNLMVSLARNVSTSVAIKTLAKDVLFVTDEEISPETINNYLDILERLFVIENQEAFSANIRSSTRLKQTPKRHFTDPSLAAALLSLTPEKMIKDLELFGFLFESLAVRDIRIYAETFGAEIYHYQDYRGREVDIVVALPDGDWVALEVKLGVRQVDKAAENLLSLQKSLANNGGQPPRALGVICGLSRLAYQRDDGVFVLPLTALKP